ncbi:MAG: helix-turn-helix domain-containing protein [Parachlamydiales bacterium]|nr:helix-turn-helix domain-containing protein [Parachlamydiales bacterium]
MEPTKTRIGEVLKTRRTEMNLSLKEIENATSIRMNYLQAIEEGDMTKMISPVYAQGFTKKYATFLGLDVNQLVKENPQIFYITPPKQDFAYGIGTVEARGTPGGGVKWLPNLLWVVVSVGVIVAGWFFGRYMELF